MVSAVTDGRYTYTHTHTHTAKRKATEIFLSTGNSDDRNTQLCCRDVKPFKCGVVKIIIVKLALEQYMPYLICNFL